ncbi:hypothetical protein DFH06DRAFT_63978 [Mycena polygramma]|nr:hypothetical protein DFH06DRAFT_63978 [Mycena polygramma]
MPPKPSVTQIRLTNIKACLAVTVDSLEVLASGLKEPSLEAICYTTKSLLNNVETIKQNKDECAQLLEQTHELLNAVLVTYIKSDTGVDLAPNVLNQIGKFTQTLHKVHTFVEAQQKGSKIKRLFCQGDLSTILKGCKEGLQQGLDSFQIDMGRIMTDIAISQRESRERHAEVLHLIETLSDADSEISSFISRVYPQSHNSTTSVSMLPSDPQIFHGRDSELSDIFQLFSQENPRIAILGAGGMGKTTLARTVLHHAQITTRYEEHQHFVACDSATTKVELAALIGAHIGLKPGQDLTRAVVQHFSSKPESLLILDNLETVWEPMECRKEIEEFLSLLTDVGQLALIVTMRGAERPAKVAWTHPFLPPLSPLEQDAARQMFLDIADDVHNQEDIDKVLALTDNMPLAISLLAHVGDEQGCPTVLSRWEEEKTSVISHGWDRTSNLEFSISLSLSSPRLEAFPDSHKLLSLLSMLPNGLSNVELVQSKLPIEKILGCKAALVGTSLAYTDSNKRLKALVPVREYIQKIQPPPDDLINALRRYFQELLVLERETRGTLLASGTVARISSNFANIQNILRKGLQQDHPDLLDCIYCTCYLNQFNRLTTQGEISLMRQIPNLFPVPYNPQLEGHFANELLNSWHHGFSVDLDTVIDQGLTHVEQCDDLDLKCSFHLSLALIYRAQRLDLSTALNVSKTALFLATSTGNTKRQGYALYNMAWINWHMGYYSVAQGYSKECQRLARISADLYSEAQGLEIEATCCFSLGDYSHSLSLCKQARNLLVACGMSHSTLDHDIMVTQAEVHRLKSEYTEAQNIQQQILQATSIIQNPHNHALALLNIAQIDVSMDVPKHAVQNNIDSARKLFSTIGSGWGAVTCDSVLADLILRDGNPLAAKSVFLECLNRFRGKDAELTFYFLGCLGDASRCNPSLETPNWATILLVYSVKLKEKVSFYKALLSLGQIFHNQRDEDTATSLLNVALEGFTRMDVHCSRAECMLHLGSIYKGRGDLEKAVELWDTARPLFERSSQCKQVKKIDERLASIGNDLLEQHRTSLALLAELNVPSGTIEEAEDDLSDTEDMPEELVDEGKSALVLA